MNMTKMTPLLLSAALLLCGQGLAATGFTDVPEDAWCAEAVTWCRENQVMQETTPGAFSPDASVTRLAAMDALYRLAGAPAPEGQNAFSDVPDAFADAAAWAAEKGVATGYEDGTFRPDSLVTRQQLAAFFWRLADRPQAENAPAFADAGTVSAYAAEAVGWADEAGVIHGYGDGTFRPGGTASRAHLAQMLFNYARSRAQATGTEGMSQIDALCAPSGIAMDRQGMLLITDTYNKLIWRSRAGAGSRFAGAQTVEGLYGEPLGGYNDTVLRESFFRNPWAIAPFLDGWAVSDADNHAVRLLREGGTETVNASAKSGLQVTDLGVEFQHPTGLAADEAGNLYVADTFAGIIVQISPQGQAVKFAENLSDPMGLAWYGGALYVAETGANRIVRLAEGKAQTVAGSGAQGFADGPAGSAQFSAPQAVAVGQDGTLYVSDTANAAVRMVKDGQVTTLVSQENSAMEACPVSPVGLLAEGNLLYVCDNFARKVFTLAIG